jgi:hypothetical protein
LNETQLVEARQRREKREEIRALEAKIQEHRQAELAAMTDEDLLVFDDREHFGDLFRRYGHILIQYLLKRGDREKTFKAFSDAWLRIGETRQAVENGYRFRPTLFALALNILLASTR